MMNWFFASGDAPFFFDDQLRRLSLFPDTWSNVSGFGQSTVPRLWIDYPFHLISSLLSQVGFSWFIIDKLWWVFVLSIAIYSTYSLGMYWFRKKNEALLFSLFYILNTYSVLLFDGGQIGIAFGVALVPLVIHKTIQFYLGTDSRKTMWYGLLLSLLLASDLRVFYMTAFLIIGVGIYLYLRKKIVFHPSWIVVPIIMVLIHAYWLLPLMLYPYLIASYQSSGNVLDMLRFYSVADFTHAFSLLHPNWPENIFGKVYFFRPEFLLIPIISFSFFLHEKVKRAAFFLMLVGICGAFLAKGVQEPFGEIYVFLYNYVPGFSLFRDPTKWYLYVVFSYALLFVYSVTRFSNRKVKLLLFMIWVLLLIPVFQSSVRGNITPPQLTQSDIALHTYLQQEHMYRTLWLPTVGVFAHKDENQPAVTATDIFEESSPSGIVRELQKSQTLTTLQERGIKYIIVPPDHEHKIFFNNYVYDSQERDILVQGIQEMPTYRNLSFADYAVYEVPSPTPLITGDMGQMTSTNKGNNRYDLKYSPLTSTITVLWTYDPGWVLTNGTVEIMPVKTDSGFMNFILPQSFDEHSQLVYKPQQFAETGAVISIISISILLLIGLIKRT